MLRPVLVEANPRILGGIMPTVYARATGRSIYSGFLQILMGDPIDCARPRFDGCVTGRRFFAREDSRLPDGWDTRWLAAYSGELIQFDPPDVLGLRPSQPVRRGQVVAHLIARGTDYAETAKTGVQIAGLIEKFWKIPIMPGEYD
jgi:biotin carboxylase